MKSVIIATAASLAMLIGGCATTTTNMSETDMTLEKLKRENDELRMQLAHTQAPVQGTARRARPVPPPSRAWRGGPPQNWAWLHVPPEGCDRGPLAWEFRNETGYFLKLFLDGKQMAIRGGEGMMPMLPPGATAYVCLDHLGAHSIQGIAYVGRFGRLTEYDRFDIPAKLRDRRGAYPRNTYTISEYQLKRY